MCLAQYVRPVPPTHCDNTSELSFSTMACAISSIGVSDSKWSVHVRLLGGMLNLSVVGVRMCKSYTFQCHWVCICWCRPCIVDSPLLLWDYFVVRLICSIPPHRSQTRICLSVRQIYAQFSMPLLCIRAPCPTWFGVLGACLYLSAVRFGRCNRVVLSSQRLVSWTLGRSVSGLLYMTRSPRNMSVAWVCSIDLVSCLYTLLWIIRVLCCSMFVCGRGLGSLRLSWICLQRSRDLDVLLLSTYVWCPPIVLLQYPTCIGQLPANTT